MEDIVESKIVQFAILVFVVIGGILLVKAGASYIPDRGGLLSATKRTLLAV